MPDVPGTLAAALADRYEVERELGRGGHGVVYLAQDLKHRRPVALKVLLPDLALSVSTERFVREVEIAAHLTHPHILPVHDSGTVNGCLYYVMPYVEGETLRDRLEREQRLSVEDAIQIARQVADALDYAHRQGIVHRDVKPENILLEAGHAVVADFGLARALVAAAGPAVSQAGIAMGTPLYMSPEQGTGNRDLDGRSDIYSLGCVLYEMLAGQPPFTGETGQEILARHALEPVPPLRRLRREIPDGVEQAIGVALAKQPAERFATVAEFAEALAAPETAPLLRARRRRRQAKWLFRGAATVAVGIVGTVALVRWRATGLARGAVAPSVAVLPFVNLSGDSADQYFSAGMTEELINALGRLEGLRVPGRGSSFAYQGKNVPYRQIGTDLGVATVLEGSVRKSSRGLRVSARLVNVADGYQIWSEQYDRTLQDLVAVQEDIAGAVAGALRVKLASGGPASPARRYTDNFEAYDLYLRGRFLFRNQRNGAGIEQAIEYFNRAIALDSSYALAYSGLAEAYVVGEAIRFSQAEFSVKAKAAALRAVALDSQLADAHASLGRVRQFEWDWQGAERAYRRAIQLDPRNAQAHGWYGYFLAVVMSVKGRADEGVRETSLAVDLDPLDPSFNVLHGIALRYARRYDEAIAYHRRAAELSAQFGATHYNRAWAYLYKRMYPEALAELDTAARQTPSQFGDSAIPSSWRGAPPRPVVVGVIYARQGRRAEAMAILRDVEKRTRRPPWIARAYIYAALGDRERTLEALDHMIEQRAMGYGANLGSEQWDVVRSDPRFEHLLAKAGLE